MAQIKPMSDQEVDEIEDDYKAQLWLEKNAPDFVIQSMARRMKRIVEIAENGATDETLSTLQRNKRKT
jgi:hypothetical protein